MTCGRRPVSLQARPVPRSRLQHPSQEGGLSQAPLVRSERPSTQATLPQRGVFAGVGQHPNLAEHERNGAATYAVDSEAQMQTLAASDFPAIPASPSGPACMAIPKLSKTLVSYIVGLMVTIPYYRGNCDDRIKGLVEQYVKLCLATLNTINGKAYKAFLQGRVTAWYALYPEMRPAPKARSSSVGSEEEEEAKDSGEEGQIGGSAPDLE